MPRIPLGWRWVLAVAVLAVLAGLLYVGEPLIQGNLQGRLTSHCKAFVDAQPESHLTFPGGKVLSFRSSEGYRVFNEYHDPLSAAYIDVPAPQSVVDAWYAAWLMAHGYSRAYDSPGLNKREEWWRRNGDRLLTIVDYGSWPGDIEGEAGYPADPSKKGITAVSLIYKVSLGGSMGSTLCS